MAFDASVIGSIGKDTPSYGGIMKDALTLKDLINTDQVNKLDLNRKLKDQSDQEKKKQILSGQDISSSEGLSKAAEALNKGGFTEDAKDLIKLGQQVQSGDLAKQRMQLEMADKQQDMIAGALDSVLANADRLRQSGSSDAMINATIQRDLMAQADQLKNQTLPNGQPVLNQQMLQAISTGQMTYDRLKSLEMQSNRGQELIKTRLQETRALTDQKRADTQERNIDSEIKTREENTKIKQASSESGLSDRAKDIMSEMTVQGITLPQGMRSKKVLYDTVNNIASKYPDKQPEEIANMIRTGQIDMTGSKTEATAFARREAGILPVEKSIVKQGGFLDQAEEAVNRVDFSKLKMAGKFENWTKDQNSDPDLASYKARVAELRAEYALVLSKGGQVTDAARHESEKVIPDIITKDQFKQIRNVITQGIEAAKSGVHESMEENAGRKPKSSSGNLPKQNAQGWTLHVDANGNKAYVSPDGKQFEEAK